MFRRVGVDHLSGLSVNELQANYRRCRSHDCLLEHSIPVLVPDKRRGARKRQAVQRVSSTIGRLGAPHLHGRRRQRRDRSRRSYDVIAAD